MADFETILGELVDLDPTPFSMLSKTAQAIHRARLREAGETLRRRIRRGRPHLIAQDSAAALVFDFLRAAEDGAAQLNLEVMAELLINGVSEDGLTEEEVRAMMRMVRDLSYDEMRALAALLRAQKAYAPPPDLNEPPTKAYIVANIYDLAWHELAGPGHNEPPDWVVGTFGALMRTGLLYTDSAWEGMKYAGTPMLAKLASLLDAGAFPSAGR